MRRIDWIDSLKGFGIFCVTLGHLGCNSLLETHIYSFHMFLFFFLSGFLHSNCGGDFKKYISKKTKTLFVPFLTWNVISCLAGLLMNYSISETIRLFFLLDGTICWNAPIWFLLLLFMVEIVFFFIEKHIPYGKFASIPILFILWVFLSGRNIFLKANILPVCLLFYTLGAIFKQFYDKYNGKIVSKKIHIFLIACLLFCINVLFGIILNNRISFTGANFGNVIYCGLAAISGVLFYITVFQHVSFLRTNKILSYLSKNSLIIFATQYWFFTLYDAVSKRLLNGSIWHYRNTIKAFVVTVITILLICTIAEAMKKIGNKSTGFSKLCGWFGLNISKH